MNYPIADLPQPETFGKPVFQSDIFKVIRGKWSKSDWPVYLVISKQHDIVEFVSENFLTAKEWVQFITKALTEDVTLIESVEVFDGKLNG